MKVIVSQSEPLEAGAGLAVVGLYEDGSLPEALAALAGAGDAKGAFKKKLLLHAGDGPRARHRPRQARGGRRRAPARRRGAGGEGGRAAGGELGRLGAAGVRRRRRRRGSAGRPARSSAPTASTASRARGRGRRRAGAGHRVADAAGAGGRRRGGRDGARLRRGPEPRPRPAEHPRQLRHAELPGGPRRGDRRRPRAPSRSTCSGPSRSPPRAWAAWSPSAAAAASRRG